MNDRLDHEASRELAAAGEPNAQQAPRPMAPGLAPGVLQRKLALRLQRRASGAEASVAEPHAAGTEGASETAQALSGDGGTARGVQRVVQRKEKLPEGKEGFGKMWDAHPHNYQDDQTQDTSSADLLDAQGLPTWLGNTCAVRMSTMLNTAGYEITPAKAKAAGLARAPMYSKKTKHYYIVAANEMWTYLAKNFRAADQDFPPTGKPAYKDAGEFQTAFDKDVKPILSGRKGIAAFETIFGYGGTGHVDLFDGEHLSDAPGFYPCKRLHLWYVVVP